jgi:hypothetical protein
MGIDVNIMMMFLLWLFHWREGSGDHLDNCLHLFFIFIFCSFLIPLDLSARLFHVCTLHQQCHNFQARSKSFMHFRKIRISVWTFFEIEVFLLFLSSAFMFNIGNVGQDDLTMLLNGCHLEHL